MVFDYGFNVETAGDHPVWHRSEVDVLPGHHDAPSAPSGRKRRKGGIAEHARDNEPLRPVSIRFTLQPVPPFRLDLTAWALRRRPHNAVDRWDGDTYRRVLG